MKHVQNCILTVFPLPWHVRQLFQSQSFLSNSVQFPSCMQQPLQQSIIIKCLQFQSQQQALLCSNRIAHQSTSIFYLKLHKRTISYSSSRNRWSLIIQMQMPTISLRQKLDANKDQSKHFTETQIIQIVNCLLILLEKYVGTSLYDAKFLIDHILYTNNQTIKLAAPFAFYPYNNTIANNQRENGFLEQSKISFSLFLLQVLTLTDNKDILRSKNIHERLNALQFQSFCMKQLKEHLLTKFKHLGQRRSSNKNKPKGQDDKIIDESLNQRKVPIKNGLKRSKASQTLQLLLFAKWSESQGQNDKGQVKENGSYLDMGVKFLSLHQLAREKVVQSFQQDQYSYALLESSTTSPSRYSPSKVFAFLQQSEDCHQATSNQAFQSQIPQRIGQQQQSSHSYQVEHEDWSQQQQQLRQRNISHEGNSRLSANMNSIIFEVQDQSLNQEPVEKQDLVLSLSFNNSPDQTTQYAEIYDQQNGTKYFGDTIGQVKQGKGKIFYPDGGLYEGEWKNGQISGFGKLFYPSNNLAYAGFWKNGCFHGPGLVLNEEVQPVQDFDFTNFSKLGRTWVSYKGNFNMDVRQGLGVVKISNGDTISGKWQNNQLNGESQYRRSNTSRIKGIWKMNRLQKIIQQVDRSQQGK